MPTLRMRVGDKGRSVSNDNIDNHLQPPLLSVKLDPNQGIRYLNNDDVLFLEKVIKDLDSYLSTRPSVNSVLLFPPLNNWRRFLIHHTVCDSYAGKHNLSSISVGEGAARRIVVCDSCLKTDDPADKQNTPKSSLSSIQLLPQPAPSKSSLLRDAYRDAFVPPSSLSRSKALDDSTSSCEKVSKEVAMNIYTPPHLRRTNGTGEGGERRLLTSSENLERRIKTEAPSKINRTRRPDQKVYVPRALRSTLPSTASQIKNASGNGPTPHPTSDDVSVTTQIRNDLSHSNGEHPSQDENKTNGDYIPPTRIQTTKIPSLPGSTTQNSNIVLEKIELRRSKNLPCDTHEKTPNSDKEMRTFPSAQTADSIVEQTIFSHDNALEEKSYHSTSSELISKESQELGPEQNETLKILNVPDHCQQSTESVEQSQHNVNAECTNSEINAQEICRHSEKEILGENAIDINVQMEMDNSKDSNEDSFMDASEEQYNSCSDITAVPDNTQLNTAAAVNSVSSFDEIIFNDESLDSNKVYDIENNTMEHDSDMNDAGNQCDIEESSVPFQQEDTSVSTISERIEIGGSKDCTIVTSDSDSEVPSKVRVVETCSVSTSTTADHTQSEILEVIDDSHKESSSRLQTSESIAQPVRESKSVGTGTDPFIESIPSQSTQDIKHTEETLAKTASEAASEPSSVKPTSNSSPVKLIRDNLSDKSESKSSSAKSVPESSPSKSVNETPTQKVTISSPSKSVSEVPTVPSQPSPAVSSSKPTGSSSPVTKSRASPVILNPDECDWETLYDDDGDCLVPDIMNEVMNKMGNVSVQSSTEEYRSFQNTEERTCDGENILEIYGFSSSFTNRDLMDVFAAYQRSYFHLKWVDDTHALGVFSSPLVADEVLNTNLPNVKTRPLKEASALSKAKAKTLNLISTPLPRPKTCVSSARRLVSGALGIKLQVSETKREEERQMLKDAREKKRQEARQRQDIWEKD